MLKLFNCEMGQLGEAFSNKKLFIFGVGDYFRYYIENNGLEAFKDQVEYVIDNHYHDSQIHIWGRNYPVYRPERLKQEDQGIVVITSTNNMKEMYNELNELSLSSGICCYVFPFIQLSSFGKKKVDIVNLSDKHVNERINKTIHCFWFSGDKKPEIYEKCKESWSQYCPDYEIIEWNKENYDCNSNQFARKAIEEKKYAFASDFARLDVLYQYGGVYLDLDVELRAPIDDLLSYSAFFSFDPNLNIDLAVLGAEKGNGLIGELRDLYRDAVFENTSACMNYYCQPRYVRDTLQKTGLIFDGETQVYDDMIFFARDHFMPLDTIIYNMSALTNNTRAIHHFNAGWKEDGYREKRIHNNRWLWKQITV